MQSRFINSYRDLSESQNISMISRSSSGGYFAHCRPLPDTTAKLLDKSNPRSYALQRLATRSSSGPFLDTAWWSTRNAQSSMPDPDDLAFSSATRFFARLNR